MGSPRTPPAPSRLRLLPGLAGRLGPIGEARGTGRVMLWVGIAITSAFILLAVFAPVVSPYDFDQFRSNGHRFAQLEAPSRDHLMGTTVQSTDVLSRVIWGTRTELKVVLVSLLLSLTIGIPLGLVSGYFGGKLDRALVLIMDAMLAFPFLLLAIVIAFLLAGSIGKGILTAAIAITVAYIPCTSAWSATTRSASARSPTSRPRVPSARRPFTVIRKYVFFNVVQNVPPLATLNAADAILTLAALGFLGYGIQPTDAAEWGYDIQRAVSDASSNIWWTGMFPGLAIVLLVTGITLLGEGLNETLNPVLRKRPSRSTSSSRPPDHAADGRRDRAPVVSVRDLRVYYGTPRGSVRAVDGVSLTSAPARWSASWASRAAGSPRFGRGILGLLPEGAASDGEVIYGGRNLVGMSPKDLRKLRGPDLGLVFQEPMTRLNPLMRIEDHFKETLEQHEPKLTDREIRTALARDARDAWGSRRRASGSTRTSSPAACGSGS